MSAAASGDREVDELAEMVAGGQISTAQLQDVLDGSSEADIDVSDEALEESARLNAKLRAMEEEFAREDAARDHQIRRKPQRGGAPKPNRTVQDAAEQRRIQRDNLNLLSKLQRIQNKGGNVTNQPHSKPVKMRAAASINRYKKQQAVERENLQFLKRLQGVKSTMRTGAPASHTRVVVAKPKPARQSPKPKPQWVDLQGGMYL